MMVSERRKKSRVKGVKVSRETILEKRSCTSGNTGKIIVTAKKVERMRRVGRKRKWRRRTKIHRLRTRITRPEVMSIQI